MIEMLEPIVIPNVGAYNTGSAVTLNPELEAQLVASGKAKLVEGQVIEPATAFQSLGDED